jgi:carbon-monoxide dehydrogenase medium subunit
MLVLDTEVLIASSSGERTVPLAEFFTGPSRTVLKSGEIVTRFSVPKPLPRTGAAYWKHTRREAMDLPILGVATLLSFDEDLKTCTKARIALGVAAPTPMRAKDAEAFLQGKTIDETTLAEAGRIAAEQASPRTTIRGAEWYRRDMIRVLVKRTGLICRDRAKGAGA